MSSLLLLAKGDGGVEALMALVMVVVLAVVFLVVLAVAPEVEMAVVLRNGVPYCRRCGRQVSRRRDHCRACGLSLYVAKSPPPPPDSKAVEALRAAEALRVERLRKEGEEWRLEQERRRTDRDAARAARRADRDADCRARGLEPGPWAWFQALPDLLQALLLGLAFAIPAGAVAFAILRPRP